MYLFSAAALSAQTQLWYQKQSGNIGPALNVVIAQNGTIFSSVYNKGIFRSLDTGATWQQIAPFTDGAWTLALRSSGEIIASLWSRGIFRSTDHGTTWSSHPSNRINSDIRAVNLKNEIFIESAGKFLYSAFNDTNWIELPVGGGVVSVNGSTLYSAKGTAVFRSTDHGKLWSQLADVVSPVYALASDADGEIVAGTYVQPEGAAHSIFSYNTVSNTWSANGPPSTVNAIVRRHDGILFAGSHDSGFYFSTNRGAEWKQYNAGLSTPKIYSMALLNDTTIVAGTVDGIFFSTGILNALLPVESEKIINRLSRRFTLEQNYPNPFNPSTTIEYFLPVETHVVLKLYDLLGRTSILLAEGVKAPGRHTATVSGANLPTGTYLYQLRTGNSTLTRKMLLLR